MGKPKQRPGKGATHDDAVPAASGSNDRAAAPLPPAVRRTVDPARAWAAAASPLGRSLATHAAAWLAMLMLYLRTRYAGISGGDSGELLAVACQGGVAHPPGYPLYTMLVRLFLRLPLGNPAERAAALSAAATATAALVLGHAVRRLCPHGGGWASLTSAGMFAFSPLVWTHATQPEVFALNNLLAASLLLLVGMWFDTPETRGRFRTARDVLRQHRVAKVAAFVAGLALCNQHTIALFLLPAGVGALWHRRGYLSTRLLLACVGCGLLGLLPYVYLPLASRPPTQYAWGDTSSLSGLLAHFLRREYGSLQMTGVARMQDERSRIVQLALRVRMYLADVATTQAPFFVLTLGSMFGWAASWKRGVHAKFRETRNREAHWTLLGCWLFYLLGFHLLANIDLDRAIFHTVQARFWQQPNLLLYTYLGPGVHHALQLLQLPPAVEPALAVALVVYQVGVNFREQDKSRSRLISMFARDVLGPLPPESLLLVSGEENLYPLVYMQSCERVRRDVRLVSKELLTIDWYVKHQAAYLPGVVFPGLRSAPTGSTGRQSQRPGTFLLSDFLVQNMPLRPVFVLGGAKANFLPAQLDEPTMKAHSVYAWPEGLSEALYNGTLHPSVDSLFKYHAAIVNRLSITPNRFKPSETEASWEWLALDAFWNCHYRMAWHMINYGIRDAGEHKYIVESDDETGDVKQEEVDTDSQSKRAFRLAMEIYQTLEKEDGRQAKLPAHQRSNYDLSFDGYIYKNLGYIMNTLRQDQETFKTYLKAFLRKHKSFSDPDLERVLEMVEWDREKWLAGGYQQAQPL